MKIKNPILIDFPMPLTTKRLIIRPLMLGDGLELFEAIDESRASLRQWLGWVDNVKTWEDSEANVREFYARFTLRTESTFLILVEGRLVGVCNYHDFDWHIPSAAIGYWCRLSAQGQGYIREAVRALTLYGFQCIGLKRLTITCDDENTKSIAVCEALGFHLETKAKGLLTNPLGDDLRICRRYVRFDPGGLGAEDISW
jgi:ribosomal-protein-serine acetyltransferase